MASCSHDYCVFPTNIGPAPGPRGPLPIALCKAHDCPSGLTLADKVEVQSLAPDDPHLKRGLNIPCGPAELCRLAEGAWTRGDHADQAIAG